MANRTGRSFVRRATRRPVQWSNVVARIAAAAVTDAKVLAGLSALGIAFTQSVTLMRTRGTAFIHFDPTSINDVQQVGIALGVFSTDAFVAGVASVPGPLTDAGYDWIFHKVLSMGPAVSATESETSILQSLWIEVDSKAMRKLKDNQTIGWVVEAATVSGGGSVDFAISSRHLIKV